MQKLTSRAFTLSVCLTLAVVSCSLLLANPAHGQIIQEKCIYGTVPELVGCGYSGCTTYATIDGICNPVTPTCQNLEAGVEYMDQCCNVFYGNWGVLPQSQNFCEQLARGPEGRGSNKVRLAYNTEARPKQKLPAVRRPSRYVYLPDCKGGYDLAILPSSL